MHEFYNNISHIKLMYITHKSKNANLQYTVLIISYHTAFLSVDILTKNDQFISEFRSRMQLKSFVLYF